MKTEAQIKGKIKEIEEIINELKISDETTDLISELLACRDLAKWVLDEKSRDDYQKKIIWEMMCFESTKIF
jgi:hypothetical protein